MLMMRRKVDLQVVEVVVFIHIFAKRVLLSPVADMSKIHCFVRCVLPSRPASGRLSHLLRLIVLGTAQAAGVFTSACFI